MPYREICWTEQAEDHEITEEEFERGQWEEPEQVPAEAQMVTYSIRLPKTVVDAVRARAKDRGVKPTAYLRELVEAAVAQKESTIPVSVILAAITEYEHAHPESRVA